MIVAATEIRVRYAETDKMGIVYHGIYLTWFEVGRIVLLDEIGLPYRDLEEAGFRLPVLEVGVRYHRPAYFDDRIKVETSITDRPAARIEINYQLFRKEEIICTGFTRHAFVNEEGSAVRPPVKFVEKVDSHF